MTSLSLLKKELSGPVIPGVNPKEHSIDDILKSYFLEIVWLAGRYARPNVEVEDLVVEGLIGLLDACERFDPERNKADNAFHNLAIVRIKSQMYEYYLRNHHQYHIPNYMARLISLIEQIRGVINNYELQGDLNAELLRPDCSEALMKVVPQDGQKRIVYLKERIRKIAENSKSDYEEMVSKVLKMEADMESAAAEEEGTAPSPEEIIADKDFLEKFFSFLTPKAKAVLLERLKGETLRAVGEEQEFTRERARQLQQDALESFKKTRMFKEATK